MTPMKESAKAIEAYGAYRDIGTARSLDAVARECHKSRSLIARWSLAHGWQARIAEHERTVAQRRAEDAQRADVAERDRLRQLRLTIAVTEQTIALKSLHKLSKDEKAIEQLGVRAIVSLLKNAHETQRLEYGEATSRTGKPLEEMSDVELLEYGRSLGLHPADRGR